MILAGLGMLVIAVIFFAVNIPAAGAVFLVLMLACGVVGLVQAAKGSRAMREAARSINSDLDKLAEGGLRTEVGHGSDAGADQARDA
jgi:hypothetical protein